MFNILWKALSYIPNLINVSDFVDSGEDTYQSIKNIDGVGVIKHGMRATSFAYSMFDKSQPDLLRGAASGIGLYEKSVKINQLSAQLKENSCVDPQRQDRQQTRNLYYIERIADGLICTGNLLSMTGNAVAGIPIKALGGITKVVSVGYMFFGMSHWPIRS